jgi:hypothetical protein
MRQLSNFCAALLLGIALTACSGIKYNADYDPAFDFSKFSTYLWADASALGENARGVSGIMEARVINAIDNNLAAKGYRKTTSVEDLDFVVNFIATTQEKTDYTTYYSGWGYRGGWYGGTGTSTTYSTEWTEGTLIVDIFDAASKQLVWRGTAEGTVDPNASPEQREKRIHDAVSKLLERFPARP